jgi:hypothetical protein
MGRPGRLTREVFTQVLPFIRVLPFTRAVLGRARSGRAGLLLLPVALVAPLSLAACGSVAGSNSVAPAISTGAASSSGASPSGTGSAGTGSAGTAAGVCASQRALTSLTIQRAGAVVRVPQEMFTLPPVTVKPSAVRSLARALCALPPFRPGTANCPADLGIFYKLRFSAGQWRFRVVTVDASGCRLVHGLGAVRSAAGATAFWTAIGRAYRPPGRIGRQA